MFLASIPAMLKALADARPALHRKNRRVGGDAHSGVSRGRTGRLRFVVLSMLAIATLWLQTAWAGGFVMVCPALRGDKLNHQHACEAEDHSPPLQFAGIPAKSKSMAVLMTDQGSSKGDSTLWIVYNLPPKTMVLPENQPHTRSLKTGGMQLQNADGKLGYKGPCPVTGATRRFVIESFVLDTSLDLPDNATRRDFLLAVEGHILARAKIGGRYRK